MTHGMSGCMTQTQGVAGHVLALEIDRGDGCLRVIREPRGNDPCQSLVRHGICLVKTCATEHQAERLSLRSP